MQYSKAKMNPAYLQDKSRERIPGTLPPAMLGMLNTSL